MRSGWKSQGISSSVGSPDSGVTVTRDSRRGVIGITNGIETHVFLDADLVSANADVSANLGRCGQRSNPAGSRRPGFARHRRFSVIAVRQRPRRRLSRE